MITYLIWRGSSPSVVSPSMISGWVAHAKFVSMMTRPSLVRSAHEECWRVPSQNRLSNTLYGDAYHVARSGVPPAPRPPAARPAAGAAGPAPAGAVARPTIGAAAPPPRATAAGAAPVKQRLTNVAR